MNPIATAAGVASLIVLALPLAAPAAPQPTEPFWPDVRYDPRVPTLEAVVGHRPAERISGLREGAARRERRRTGTPRPLRGRRRLRRGRPTCAEPGRALRRGERPFPRGERPMSDAAGALALFAALWAALCVVLSRSGGWHALASHYRATTPFLGTRLRFRSAPTR